MKNAVKLKDRIRRGPIANMLSQELQPYNPAIHLQHCLNPARWEKAWAIAPQLVALLKQQFGATRVVVFGSLTHRDCYTHWSDIDLAAWGIPPEQFYRAIAALNKLSPDINVDLIDPQRCQSVSIQQSIQQEGIEL
jgi:uncharacterized protein